tara:strand:- start:4 stop:384 length:381 start_codon:yes stop_codon:yes gene_type:complete
MFNKTALFMLLLTLSFSAFASMPVQKLLQLIDYVGVDYREAIKDEQVINPEEYREMQDFVLAIQESIDRLNLTEQSLIEQAATLKSLVNSKADPGVVAELTTTMHQQIITNYNETFARNQETASNI